MKKILLFSGLILFGFIFTGCTKKEVDYTFHDEAVRLLESLEYDEALLSFKKSINQNPSLTDSYVLAAEILSNRKMYEEAVEILDAGIGFASDQSEIYEKLGEIYSDSDDSDKSEFYFAKSYSRNGDNIEAYVGYIKVLIKNNNFAKAKDVADDRLDKADDEDVQTLKLALFADDVDALDKIRISSQTGSGTDTVISDLFDDIDTTKELQLVNQMEIEQMAVNSMYKFAVIPVLSDIINKNELYDGAYLYRGLALLQLEQYLAAESDFSSCITYNSELADCYRYLGVAQTLQGEFDKAEQNFNLALIYGADSRLQILEDYITLLDSRDDYQNLIQTIIEIINLGGGEIYEVRLGEIYCEQEGFVDELADLDSDNQSLNACLLTKNNDIVSEEMLDSLKGSNDPFSYFVLYRYYEQNSNVESETIKARLREIDLSGKYSNLIK